MLKTIKVKVKKLYPNVELPKKAHDLDAGYDVKAVSCTYDETLDAYIYGTGLAFQTDTCNVMKCFCRSSNRKTEYYLTNHTGIGDLATYTGEYSATFKHRDSLKDRLERNALTTIARMPWYKRLFVNFDDVFAEVRAEFFKDPMKYAPYQVGDRIIQVMFAEVNPVEFKSVAMLKGTVRGDGGHGSTGK